MGERSTFPAASRGADFSALTPAASLSDCERTLASSSCNPAIDLPNASVRSVCAGSALGLSVFASSAATRDESWLNAAALICGGACTTGHPSIQPTPITSAAAAAPENGAITQGEMRGEPAAPASAAGCSAADDGPESGSEGCSAAVSCGCLSPSGSAGPAASPCSLGDVVTSVAARSI